MASDEKRVKGGKVLTHEQRTARLTVLIDPRKKAVLESLCAAEDVTPSQLVRSLIRRYIEDRLGEPWTPEPKAAPAAAPPRRRGAGRRS